MRDACALIVFILLLASTGSVVAEEPSATERFEKARDELPAPREGIESTFEGHFLVEGRAAGSFRLSVSTGTPPGSASEKPAWKVTIEQDASPAIPDWRIVRTTWLDSRLQPIRGSLDGVEIGGRRKHRWSRSGDELQVESSGEGMKTVRRVASWEAPATTWAGLVLFARHVHRTKARYEMRVFNPAWEYLRAERPFTGGVVEALGPTPWRDRTASVVRLRGVGREQLMAFEPDSGVLLGITMRAPNGDEVHVVPGALPKETDADDPFEGLPTTPQHGAMQVALAFQTGDAERFEKIVHWPSLREALKASIKGKVSDEAFKEAILKQFRGAANDAPEDATRQRLVDAQDELEVETRGEDAAVVTLPESFGRMRITLGRFEGAWLLVRPPGA